MIILAAYVNPARAGMIPLSMRAQGLADRKPRASGDDPEAVSQGRPVGV